MNVTFTLGPGVFTRAAFDDNLNEELTITIAGRAHTGVLRDFTILDDGNRVRLTMEFPDNGSSSVWIDGEPGA